MGQISFSSNGFNICIKSNKDKITNIDINSKNEQSNSFDPILLNAKKQIVEYLSGKRNKIKLEYFLDTTKFAKKVYNVISDIPYGETMTYGEIAQILGNKNKARAVGNALNKNDHPILIPCHRVVSTKDIGGFGAGVDLKIKLIDIEKKGVK